MADPKLLNFRQRVISRDHKLIAIVALFLGGFVGRAIIDAVGAAGTLGVGTGMRVVIAGDLFILGAKGGGTAPQRMAHTPAPRHARLHCGAPAAFFVPRHR